MKNAIQRIAATARKEWQLNFRFPIEYIANNAVSPLKSAILMLLLYRGFLTGDHSLGVVQKGNFPIFVLVGTACHSLFINALSTFRVKMVQEKYWQTITGMLVSPASILEIVMGFIVGSLGIHLIITLVVLALVAITFGTPFGVLLVSLSFVLMIAFMGFGLGLIGSTVNLVWEGKCYLFDHTSQVVVFLSCFYYPIETLPKFIQPAVRWLPTYRAAEAMQHLFLFGNLPNSSLNFSFLLISTVLLLCGPALFLDYAIKRFGTVGY